APETVQLMMKHDWPGNVRELRNMIERAVIERAVRLGEGAPGDPAAPLVPDGAPAVRPGGGRIGDEAGEDARPGGGYGGGDTTPIVVPDSAFQVRVDIGQPFKDAKQDVINEFERRYILQLLAVHDGNVTQAARAAGLDRMSIHRILNRLNMENPGR